MTIVDQNANIIQAHGPKLMDDEDYDVKKTAQLVSKHEHDQDEKKEYKWQIVWLNVLSLGSLHLAGIYAFFTVIINPAMPWYGGVLLDLMGRFFAMGVTAGSHRLWSHRAYKAKLPLRIFLMILQTMCLQDDIFKWSRDHRVHHKYSDTDADPYNARRGFFFSHIGWLLVRKHPEVIAKGNTIPMSDLAADPVVRFQRYFYLPLLAIFWALLPMYLFHLVTGLGFIDCFFGAVIFRYLSSLHHAWLVNSAAHLYGYQMYDKKLEPRENRWVVYASIGEGYHNYHHTFPWDYSASELGWEKNFNWTTMFIDFCAWLGLAYDLKKPDTSEIDARVKRTGDLKQRSRLIQAVDTFNDYLLGTITTHFVFIFCATSRMIANGHF